eukprot:TRINITY_DN1959_c0_g1_i1.p1 TRINITY_DN1959_c0_g1~~TRINITY_DN1959_c0_g1_i1.p1  ORF type:complete len:538 (+),score=90.63 TRINITY_DN1959_c0_g1_i1:572-2185(+)
MFRRLLLLSLVRPPPPPGLVDVSAMQIYSFVDKTGQLAQLLSGKMGPFLHVPAMRSVGKSFTIAMLAAMARGQSEPFTGYEVASPTSPFTIGATRFHVICFNFAASLALKSETVEETQKRFVERIRVEAFRQHNIHVAYNRHPGVVLADYLWQLRQVEPIPCVLLIDEYDALVSMYLPDDVAKAEQMEEFLATFYGEIKSLSSWFHLVYVTGIGMFAQLFSCANMFTTVMKDTPAYTTLYGFTEAEIRKTYGMHITATMHRDLDSTVQQLRAMYNGYKIHPEQDETTFNPWNVLHFLQNGSLRPYWCATGGNLAAQYLGPNTTELLRGFSISTEDLFAPISAQEHSAHWQQVAVQTGYATITHFDPTTNMAHVGAPNQEVRSWLYNDMVRYLVGIVDKQALRSYARALHNRDFISAGKHLQSLLRSVPVVSRPTNEHQFEGYALHSLQWEELGFAAVLDISVDVEGAVHILVMEFKLDQSAATLAQQQIGAKDYAQRAREYLVAVDAPANWQDLCRWPLLGHNGHRSGGHCRSPLSS